MAEGKYRIVQAQLPLPAGLAHNFLVLLGPDGEVISELHGFATDLNGRPKPIGNLPEDRLKFHEYPEGEFDLQYYRPNFPQAVLIAGDQATIMNRWNAGQAAGARMDEQNIQYPILGLGKNSNSFASTLIAAMGLTEPAKRDDARVAPGEGRLLLDTKAIQDIQRQFNIASPPSPDADLQPDGAVGAPGGRTTAPSVGNPAVGNPGFRASPAQISPDDGIPGSRGPTSVGGPNGPAPLVPPLRSRSQAPPTRPAPAPETAPPVRFAPEVLPDHGPFGVPGALRSDARDSTYVAPPVNGEASTKIPILLAPAVGAPTGSARPATSAVPGSGGWSGDGEGIDDGWIGSAPAAPSSSERFLIRRPGSPIRDVTPVDPIQPPETSLPPDISASAPSLPPARFPLEALFAPDHLRALNAWASSPPYLPTAPDMQGTPGGIPGLLAKIGAFDLSHVDQPQAGGLLRLLQEYMRDDDRDNI